MPQPEPSPPPAEVRSPWGRLAAPLGLALAVLFGARAAVMNPVAAFPQRDTAFGEVAIHHLQDALLGRAAWADAPLGWPLPGGTARLDWMLGQALLTLPLRAVGAAPWTCHGAASALGLVVSALAAFGIGRRLGLTRAGALLAGLGAGLGPAALGELHHANLTWGGLGGVAVWLLLRAGRRATGAADPRRAALRGGMAGAVLAGAAHFGLYAALFSGVTFLAALPTLAVTAGRRAWLGFAAGVLAVGLTLVPVAALYAGAASAVDAGDSAGESWDPASSVEPSAAAPLHRALGLAEHPTRRAAAQRSANPGYLLGGMGVVGVSLALRRWRAGWPLVLALGLAAAAMAVGGRPSWAGSSLGVVGPYAWVDLFSGHRLRAPERWLFLVHVALALLAGLTLSAAQEWVAGGGRARKARPRASVWLSALLGAVVLLVAYGELPIAASYATAHTGFPPPAYALLEGAAPGPLFEVLGGKDPCRSVDRLRMQPAHGHPLVGGHQGRFSPESQSLNRTLDHWPSPATVSWLREAGVGLILEHPPLRPLPTDPGLVCTEAASHRLCTLR